MKEKITKLRVGKVEALQGRESDGRAGGDHELKGKRDQRRAKRAKRFWGSGGTPRENFGGHAL